MKKCKLYILAHEDKDSATGYSLTPYTSALDGDYFTTVGDFEVEMPDHFSAEYITACRVSGLGTALKELQAKNQSEEQKLKDQIAQLLCLPGALK
jgi:hypothetical protein